MHRHTSQKGAALILLLGIIAALAILASTLVFVIANQQGATAMERSRKQSLYIAEGALDSAVQVAKVNHTMSSTSEWLTPAELAAAFAGQFPAGATVTYRVYDDLATVDYNIKWDQGGPTSASTPDHMVWVEVTVTYKGKTTRARCLLRQSTQNLVSSFPRAVLYSDTGITLSGTSDIYAVNRDGTPDTSGAPFPTAVMAGGSWTTGMAAALGAFTANSSTDLAAPSTSTQSLGIKVNGSVSTPGHSFADVTAAPGTVGLLSDYFDQAEQADLGDEAQSGWPTKANASGTSVASTKFTTSSITTIPGCTFNSGTKTYTFANDLVVTGNLTLKSSGSGAFPTGTIFNFKSLYMAGNLTQTGQITIDTTALYIGGSFTISGATTAVTDQLGAVCVLGTADWSGTASVQTTNYLDSSASPAAMWIGILSRSGNYNDIYGPVWCVGNPGTSTVTVEFDGPSSGSNSVMCPLLSTTEKTVTTGEVNFGTRAKPMVYYMMCDNDALYSNTCEWGSTGTFYGLMVVMEATLQITGGDGTTPCVEGAIFEGCPYKSGTTPSTSDITLTGKSTVAYNQAVIDAVTNTSITTTTIVTDIVPGSWQQLPAN